MFKIEPPYGKLHPRNDSIFFFVKQYHIFNSFMWRIPHTPPCESAITIKMMTTNQNPDFTSAMG